MVILPEDGQYSTGGLNLFDQNKKILGRGRQWGISHFIRPVFPGTVFESICNIIYQFALSEFKS